MRRAGQSPRNAGQANDADQLRRLAQELERDDVLLRRQASRSRSGSPARVAPQTPSFRTGEDLPGDVAFPKDNFLRAQVYASSPRQDPYDAYDSGLGSPAARRMDTVAEELRQERLRRRAGQGTRAEATAAAQVAAAAEAAAERSGLEVQLALRHVEAVEARQMANDAGKAGPGFRRVRGYADGEGHDELLKDLAAAQEAQKIGSSALAHARTELAAARIELTGRKDMNQSMERELKKLQEGHDPDAAALVFVRREVEDANLENEIAQAEYKSEIEFISGELADMDAEIQVLRGDTDSDTITLAATSRALTAAQRQLSERAAMPGSNADLKALRAGRDADAKALMKAHRENADSLQEIQQRRNNDRITADELQEIEVILGGVCQHLLVAERETRKEMAGAIVGGEAPMRNPLLLPLSFSMWLQAVLTSRCVKIVNDAKIEVVTLENRFASLGDLRSGGCTLTARGFEAWQKTYLVRRATVRAVHVVMNMQVHTDIMLLRVYFAMWFMGEIRFGKQHNSQIKDHLSKVKASTKLSAKLASRLTHGGEEDVIPMPRVFSSWSLYAVDRRRAREKAEHFFHAQTRKINVWLVHAALQAWSRVTSESNFHSKVATVNKKYDRRYVGYLQVLDIRDRQIERQLQFWILTTTLTSWALQCRTAAPGTRVGGGGELLKTACQLWYFGEVEEVATMSFISYLLLAWHRLISHNRVHAQRRRYEDLLERASWHQASVRTREITLWVAFASWQVWSLAAHESRFSFKLATEDEKKDRLSKFTYTAQVEAQIWSTFLQTWNGWKTFALLGAADRNAADLALSIKADALDFIETYSKRMLAMFTGELNFRNLISSMSAWSCEVRLNKLEAALESGVEASYFEKVRIREKAVYGYTVLSSLHEQEIYHWLLLTPWVAWAITYRKAKEVAELKYAAKQAPMSSYDFFEEKTDNLQKELVFRAWKAQTVADRGRDLFGVTPTKIAKALEIFNVMAKTTAYLRVLIPLLFVTWRTYFLPSYAAKEYAANEVRAHMNKFAKQWNRNAEVKMLQDSAKAILGAWKTAHEWGIQLRTLSFTAARLLERGHLHEDGVVQHFTFALWSSQRHTGPLNRLRPPPLKPPPLGENEQSALAGLNNLANAAGFEGGHSPRASPRTDSIFATDFLGDQPRHLKPRILFETLESLVAVRSRSWRLVSDLRGMAESSLLRVAELHEAMLTLLEQAARKALHNEDIAAAHGALGPMADVLRLSAEAEKLDQDMQVKMRDRKPLSASLLECTAAAVRIVLEAKGVTSDDQRAMKLIAAELYEVRSDYRKLADACGTLLTRIEDAILDLRSLAEARQELPGTPSTPGISIRGGASGAASEGRALDGAGESARRLLQAAAAGVNAMGMDAKGLLQYLDASELLRSVAIWGVEGSVMEAANLVAQWPEDEVPDRPAAALVPPTRPERPAAALLALRQGEFAGSPVAPAAPLRLISSPVGPPVIEEVYVPEAALEGKRAAVDWLEDEVLVASGPDGFAPEVAGTSGFKALRAGRATQPRRPDYRRLGEFQIRWRRPRLQTIWRAWLLFVQLVRRLRGAALDAELQGAMDQLGGRGRSPVPLRGPRGPGPRGGPRGPASANTVGAVERLLLG